MHLVFQFPVIDFRPIVANYNSKLKDPKWPNPGVNTKSFIRHFGAVKDRTTGFSSDFSGEGIYCDSHLSMQYTDLHNRGFSIAPGIQSAIHNSYRRYFSDGYFVGRIEAGFVDNTEKKINIAGIKDGAVSITSILKHYANLPVTIDKKESKLYRAGPLLAEKYLEESTSKKNPPQDQQKYVEAGEIIVLLVFSATAGL